MRLFHTILRAIRIDPRYARAHNNLAIAYIERGRFQDAFYHFREAIRWEPRLADAHYNLGRLLAMQGQLEEAITHYTVAGWRGSQGPGYSEYTGQP